MIKLARVPLTLGVLAVSVLLLAGPGTRFGLWSYRIGLQLLQWAAYAGIAAAVLALVALAVAQLRRAGVAGHAIGLVLGLVAVYAPWQFKQQAMAVPAIHDISTDLDDPPAFVAVLPLRADAPNPATYGGPEIAAAQKAAYPDLQSVQLPLAPEAAFARALDAAKAMGWELVASDAAAGRIEATATTAWFGFKDDVVVRIVPSATGSKLDVRSVSRVGRSDVGANAKRIREYIAKLL